MEKLTAILVLIIGILLILPLLTIDIGASISSWIIAVIVLILGIIGLIKPKK